MKAARHLCWSGKLVLVGKASTNQSEPLPFLDLKSISLGQGNLGDQHRGKAEDGPQDSCPCRCGLSGLQHQAAPLHPLLHIAGLSASARQTLILKGM